MKIATTDGAVDGLLAMGIKEEAVGEAINLGSGKEHRVIDMANMVNALTGNEAGIKYAERRDWDVKTRLLSSIEKAKRQTFKKSLIKNAAQMEFEDGLKRVHDWFVENREDIERSAEF